MTHLAERRVEPVARPVPVAATRRGRRDWRSPLARHALLIGVAAVFMLPFYWMVISGLKSNSQIFARPLQWWPDPVQWQNLRNTIGSQYFPYLRLLGNSVFYAGGVTVGTVLSCAAVGYGFARLRFPGRDVLFAITLATLMIPPIVTFIPTYVLFASLHLTGGYVPLILPAFFGNAFFIFMIRQFFLGIPWDLSDAARIDGAGEFRIFWEIMLPLVRPALMVVAVFTLLYTWHEFFQPLIYLQDRAQFPLSLGLYAFRSQRTAEWASIMVGSFLTTLPLIVVFLFTQRYFLRGIATTGLKG
ncbi:MAG: carbohydrate ABC transporter permease [Chloroflexia bacterium]|nr:carbohydrate ABC transporter permease [Chloroflexia bacterium]